ncbi:MAG: glutamyl-tRNA reductase [SAR324 cluster bacterium]|nr:glutamyl-tRNA reductase [SAR324 cluster bacterium]
MINFGVVGTNHRKVAIDIREKLTFNKQSFAPFILLIKEKYQLTDVLLLGTCNRTEIYFSAPNLEITGKKIWEFLLQERGLSLKQVSFYSYTGLAAVRHLLEVASSLDSLIEGETQILGQVKEAFEKSAKVLKPSPIFARTISFAINTAKKTRTEAGLGNYSVSVGQVAVDLAKNIFGELTTKTVLVIGAGEVADLTLTYLKSRGVARIYVTNRTLDNAVKMANKFSALVLPFKSLERGILDVDIVISSVRVDEPIILADMIGQKMAQRKYKPLFFLDLGVPRNIASQIGNIDNVYLFNIDDLQQVVADNRKVRASQSESAKKILANQLEQYQDWLKIFEKRKSIDIFRKRFDEIYFVELKQAIADADIVIDEKKKISKLIHRSSQKMLHHLTTLIKDNIDEDDKIFDLLSKAFQLDDAILDKKPLDPPHEEVVNEKIIRLKQK